MVEFKIITSSDESSQMQALTQALTRICERCQPSFTNKLKLKYKDIDGDDWMPGDNPVYYVIETYTDYHFGFIPRKKFRGVCGVEVGPLTDLVKCRVFNPRVADIVKEEIQSYAEKIEAKEVLFGVDDPNDR